MGNGFSLKKIEKGKDKLNHENGLSFFFSMIQ